MEELEKKCQKKVEELLDLRRELLENQEEKQENDEVPSLPHYADFLEKFRSIEKQELHLLEINDQIQTINREKELEGMKKSMQSLRLVNDSCVSEHSFIRDWLDQMKKYEKKMEEEGAGIEQVTGDCLFYDVHFAESAKSEGTMEELSWGTRYKGKCVRVSVRAPAMCRSPDPSTFDFSASLYVDDLVVKGQEFIAGGRGPEEYVSDVLWAGLQNLIDIS